MLITLAGHVDHGKSAIVKALTGVDPDRLEEEQQRGLTIDLGFAYVDVQGHRLGFVDVPGHHKFIHNMIAGVAKMQYALVVIAADDGIMPQTREHINILELLGLQRGTIALSKVDRVSQTALAEVRDQIRIYIQHTFLREARIVEVSIPEKTGLSELQQTIIATENQFVPKRLRRGTRLNIDRSFSPVGEGTVVTGTVVDGQLNVGDTVAIPSSGQQVRVKNLVVNGLPSTTAAAGDRCGVQLAGIKSADIRRGDWLREHDCSFTTKQFTLQIQILNEFTRHITSWTAVHLYHGSSHTEGKILPLLSPMLPASKGLVDVQCATELSIAIGDRVIIRDKDQSQTIGGGWVISTSAPETRRRLTSRIDTLVKLANVIENEDIPRSIEYECQNRIVKVEELRRSWNLCKVVFNELLKESNVVLLNDRVLLQTKLNELQTRVVHFLEEFNRQSPSIPGASINEIWQGISEDTETIRFVLEHGLSKGDLNLRTGKYSLRTHQVAAPQYNQHLYQRVLPFVNSTQPATVGDIARELKIPTRNLEAEMQRFAAARLLIKVSPKRFFLTNQLKNIADLVEHLYQSGPFTVGDFRDASKMGRMAGIEVLEYFDRVRFTRREDNIRKVIRAYDCE